MWYAVEHEGLRGVLLNHKTPRYALSEVRKVHLPSAPGMISDEVQAYKLY